VLIGYLAAARRDVPASAAVSYAILDD
jgi:hypothetical protein